MSKPKSGGGSTRLARLRTKKNESGSSSSKTSVCNTSTISKYFPPINDNANCDEDTYTTPFTDIKRISMNDDADFKSPVPVRKLAKIFTSPKSDAATTKRKTKRTISRKKPETLMERALKDNLKSDMNPNHLQLALALSKSLQDAEENEVELNKSYPTTQEARENARLELFGFRIKSSNSKNDCITKYLTTDVFVNKRKKKSKFKYITPILNKRTEEQRQQLLAAKIASILDVVPANECRINETYETTSDLLKKYHKISADDTLWRIDKLTSEELQNKHLFYVSALNLDQSTAKCGNLLRNWAEIAGRDKTPPREINKKTPDNNCDKNHVSNTSIGDASRTSSVENNLSLLNDIICEENDIICEENDKTSMLEKMPDGPTVNRTILEENNEANLLDKVPDESTSLVDLPQTSNTILEESSETNFLDKVPDESTSLVSLQPINNTILEDNDGTKSDKDHIEDCTSIANTSDKMEYNINSAENLVLKQVQAKEPEPKKRIQRFRSPSPELFDSDDDNYYNYKVRSSNFKAKQNSEVVEIIISDSSNDAHEKPQENSDILINDNNLQENDENVKENPLSQTDNQVNVTRKQSAFNLMDNLDISTKSSDFHELNHSVGEVFETLEKSPIISKTTRNVTCNLSFDILESSILESPTLLKTKPNFNLTSPKPNNNFNQINDLGTSLFNESKSAESPVVTKANYDFMSASLLSNFAEQQILMEKNDSILIDSDSEADNKHKEIEDISFDFNKTDDLGENVNEIKTKSPGARKTNKNIDNFASASLLSNFTSQLARIQETEPILIESDDDEILKDDRILTNKSASCTTMNYEIPKDVAIIKEDTVTSNKSTNSLPLIDETIINPATTSMINNLNNSKKFKSDSSSPGSECEKDNGIHHFESFAEDAFELSQRYCFSDDWEHEMNNIDSPPRNWQRNASSNSLESQDSICISDEELNYSRLHSNKKDHIIDLSQNSDDEEVSPRSDAPDMDVSRLLSLLSKDNVLPSQHYDTPDMDESKIANLLSKEKEMPSEHYNAPDMDKSKSANLLSNDNEFPSQHYNAPDMDESKISSLLSKDKELPSQHYNAPDMEVSRLLSLLAKDNELPSTPQNKPVTLMHKRVQELSGCKSKPNQSVFNDTLGNLLQESMIQQQIDNNITTPNRECASTQEMVETPRGLFLTKEENVTPMPNYDLMDSPEIVNELERFGIKNLKRQRGVALLKHIYEVTHPMLDSSELDDVDVDEIDRNKDAKRRRRLYDDDVHDCDTSKIEMVEDLSTSEPLDQLIFERKRSKRIMSCQLPFHIAWHNFLSCNRAIHERILMYEPIQIKLIYDMLKKEGFHYNVQDVIAFLDRKCITIKLNDASD